MILSKNGCNDGCKHYVKVTIRGNTTHECLRGINIGLFRKSNCMIYDKNTNIKYKDIKNKETKSHDRFVL